MNMSISGWNEGLIVYVLAASSPTHPVSKDVYEQGWARGGGIRNGRKFYGVTLPLGSDYAAMARADKRDVILPHDFLIENTDDLYESCDGWYVKRLEWREEYAGQRVFLDFDGVYMDADILLDGQAIMTHRYGYDYPSGAPGCGGVRLRLHPPAPLVAKKSLNRLAARRYY